MAGIWIIIILYLDIRFVNAVLLFFLSNIRGLNESISYIHILDNTEILKYVSARSIDYTEKTAY